MKSTDKTISVLMPVYNGETFLQEALDSILGQTYTDFEFIIIDDGSEDGTSNLLDACTDPRVIRLRNEKNKGNYAARNEGLTLAQGKYICVMDADDIANPDRFSTQVAYLETHQDVVAVGSRYLFSNGYLRPVPLMYEEICLYLLEENCFLHSSLMIRTDALRKLGGYREEFVYSSDYDLICRLSLLGKIENMPDVLMTYRWHASQISQRYCKKQRECAIRICRQYQLAFITRYKSAKQTIPDERMLLYPDMGRAIAFYTYARFTGNNTYERLADELLEKTCSKLDIYISAVYGNYLCNLGCGLIYLLRNGLVNGEEEDVLTDIDTLLYTIAREEWEREDADIAGWIYYLTLRLQDKYARNNSPIRLKNRRNLAYLQDKSELLSVRAKNN